MLVQNLGFFGGIVVLLKPFIRLSYCKISIRFDSYKWYLDEMIAGAFQILKNLD